MNINEEIAKIKKQLKKVNTLKHREEETRDNLFKALFEKVRCDNEKTVSIVRTAKYELASQEVLPEFNDEVEKQEF